MLPDSVSNTLIRVPLLLAVAKRVPGDNIVIDICSNNLKTKMFLSVIIMGGREVSRPFENRYCDNKIS